MWLCFVANKTCCSWTKVAGRQLRFWFDFILWVFWNRPLLSPRSEGRRSTFIQPLTRSSTRFRRFKVDLNEQFLPISLGFMFGVVLFPGAGWISSSLVWRRWEVSPCAPARVCCRGRVWSNWRSSTRNIPQHTGSTLW